MLKSVPCQRAFRGITRSGTQECLLDHKKGYLFLIFDLDEKIKYSQCLEYMGMILSPEPHVKKVLLLPLTALIYDS